MKFKCNNCKRETDLDAGDILQMGHPICCDEDMEAIGESLPAKISLFIPVGDSAQAFATVPCTVHFHDENNPDDSDFPDVHTIEAEVITQEAMDKMVHEANGKDPDDFVDYDDVESVKKWLAGNDGEVEVPAEPKAPLDVEGWKKWLKKAGKEIKAYIKMYRD